VTTPAVVETTRRHARSGGLTRYVPILSWLPRYDRTWLTADVIAGLTLWGLVVPEAMAYAGIANLPPQAGLYTLLASLLVYAILGSSRHLVVQGTSATAALLASAVMGVMATMGIITGDVTPDPAMYQAYASAFALVVGVVFLIAGVAKLGFITQFLSKPVMDGFVMGLALFVAVGQLNKLFGVPKPEGNTLEKLVGIVRELPQANWVTFAVGASALALLFLLPRWNKKIPAGLVVLFGYIALSTALGLEANHGVEVVGTLPQGLPTIALPIVPLDALLAMVAPAVGVLLVAYSEGLGVAREFAEKHGYEVDANQELNATALSNVVSSLFGGMIAGGSMSASAVKEGAGARSQVTNLVTWGMAIVTVLFLTPLFRSLPEAVLAALIIHAVWHIIVSRKLKRVRMISRSEFLLGMLTFVGVILVDVLQGMLLGLISSVLLVVYKSSRPRISSLGRVPGVSGAFSDIQRHPDSLPVPGVLILRPNSPIYYANALTVRDNVKEMLEECEPSAIILDAAAQDSLDITTSDVLAGLVKELQDQGIAVYAAEVHAPVVEFARRSGLYDLFDGGHTYPTLQSALEAIEGNKTS
jgi:sulfate permease, SulP family